MTPLMDPGRAPIAGVWVTAVLGGQGYALVVAVLPASMRRYRAPPAAGGVAPGGSAALTGTRAR
jgi:hypothetical protein